MSGKSKDKRGNFREVEDRILIRDLKEKVLPMKTRAAWIYKSRKPWILGRLACMGTDAFNLLGSDKPLINIQKGRVDYLLDVASKKDSATQTAEVLPHILRADIKGLIAQEGNAANLPSKAPVALLIDSFSELTDQRFYRRGKNWSFLSGYSDVQHSDEFKSRFNCTGLIPIEDLHAKYQQFFNMIGDKYGKIPIVFMHFPKKLDSRVIFQERHDNIRKTIELLASERSNLVSIAVPEKEVDWPIGDESRFPYHFHSKCYEYLASEIKSKNIF